MLQGEKRKLPWLCVASCDTNVSQRRRFFFGGGESALGDMWYKFVLCTHGRIWSWDSL